MIESGKSVFDRVALACFLLCDGLPMISITFGRGDDVYRESLFLSMLLSLLIFLAGKTRVRTVVVIKGF